MTEREQKIFRWGACAGLVVTILNCWIAYRLGWVTSIEVAEGLTGYAGLYLVSWVLLQRPDQVVYMDWRI